MRIVRFCGHIYKHLFFQSQKYRQEITSKQMEQSENSTETSQCEVCRISRFDDNVFSKITCTVCKRQTHKFCYAPDLRDCNHFKCDECRKNRSGVCLFCGKSNGILKDIGDKMWAHVICALFSPKIKLQNYKSLQFKLVNYSVEKEESDVHMCEVCKQSIGQTFHCWLQKDKCQNYTHVGCIVGYKFQAGKQFYLTYNLLDKHNNALMSHLIAYQDRFESFRYMKVKKIRPVLCEQHNDDPHFIFCTCNRSRFDNNRRQGIRQVQQVECDSCKRWYHQVCVMVDNLNEEFVCSGCKENNFFKKAVQLPQLIEKMGEIEAAGKIDKQAIKILDSYIPKLSVLLIDLCLQKRSIDEINKYYCRRVLDRLYKDDRDYPQKANLAKKQQKILELLSLLTKKETDEVQNKSSKGQLQKKDILHLMNTDKNLLGLHNDCFRRYQKFLQDKMFQIQKSDKEAGINIYMQLSKYAVERDNRNETIEQIAKQTYAIIEKMQKSKQFSINIKYMTKRSKTLFDLFYRSRMTLQQYQLILKRYKRIATLRHSQVVNQSQFCELLSWSEKQLQGLSHEKRRQLADYFRIQMKSFTIMAQHQQHQTVLSSALSKISANVRPKQLCCIRKELVTHLMYLAADSPLCTADYMQTYFRIKKLKVLNLVNNPISQQLQRVVQQIRNFLSHPEYSLDMTQQQKKTIDSFFNRSRFYLQIVNFQSKTMGEKAFMSSELDQTEICFDKACTLGGMEGLQQLAFEAMSRWEDNPTSVNYAFNLLSNLISKGVSFNLNEEQKLSIFAGKILKSLYSRFQRNAGVMTSSLLGKAMTIIKLLNIPNNFPLFFQGWTKYEIWKADLQVFSNVSEVLVNAEMLPLFSRSIQEKLMTAQVIRLDLTSELRKLRVMRSWVDVSKKILSKSQQVKYSPLFIEQITGIMQKCRYPFNSLFEEISKLQNQRKMFCEKMRLFQPMKIGINDEIFDELNLINRKPKVMQAQQLIAEMQESKIDLFFQINKLEEQIEQYLLIPSDLQTWTNQQQRSSSIQNMRKSILECPFQFEPLKDYIYMYHKMYELKCYQTKVSTSRKQLNRMLNHGGIGTIFLLEKMVNLLNAYRMIENAKNEIMHERPRGDFLLPSDPRKLRNDLREDQFQSKAVDIYYFNIVRIRQKLKQMKKSRVQWQFYVELISEIYRQPVNANDLIEQINEMKKVLDECVRSAAMVEHNNNYDYDICNGLISKYKSNGVRHHKLQRFQAVYNRYRIIMDLNTQININSYPQFSKLCEEFNEIKSIKAVEQLRDKHFSNMQIIYTQSPHKLTEIGHTLIAEGRYLLKQTQRGRDVVPKLQLIAKKLFPEQMMAASSSNSSMTSSVIMSRREIESVNSPIMRKSASQQKGEKQNGNSKQPSKNYKRQNK